MRNPWWIPIGAAAALALAGCSHSSTSSKSPTVSGVSSAQQQSEQSLKQAQEAQRRASDAQRDATAAQEKLSQQQEQLSRVQQDAEQKTQAARDAQVAAKDKAQEATKSAYQAQQSAIEGQKAQHQEFAQAEQTQSVSGALIRTNGTNITVRPPSRPEVKLNFDNSTVVTLNGEPASIGQLERGQEVRASYQLSADGRTKLLKRIDATVPPLP